MLYVHYRSSHFGFLIMGVTYGASGVVAIALTHGWPLVAGFVLVWLLKLLGLELGGTRCWNDEHLLRYSAPG